MSTPSTPLYSLPFQFALTVFRVFCGAFSRPPPPRFFLRFEIIIIRDAPANVFDVCVCVPLYFSNVAKNYGALPSSLMSRNRGCYCNHFAGYFPPLRNGRISKRLEELN